MILRQLATPTHTRNRHRARRPRAMPLRAPRQQPHKRARHKERRVCIQLEVRCPLVLWLGEEGRAEGLRGVVFGIGVVAHPGRPGPGLAGVVDEDVEVAVGEGDDIFGGEDASFVGDVDEKAGKKSVSRPSIMKRQHVRNQLPSPLEFFGALLDDFLPTPTNVYLGTVRGQPLRDHEPDTRAAAGDESDAICHVEERRSTQFGWRSRHFERIYKE